MGELNQICAVILAGGQARRLNGVEKGLQLWQGKPLISHILTRLTPQIDKIWLNINRLHSVYGEKYPQLSIYSDRLANFQGALSGILTGFEQIDSEYLLFVPCDSPLLPNNLVYKLATALRINQAQIAYAHDGERPHPTFALIHRSVQPALEAYLATGERRLWQFFQTQKSIAVDFSEQPQSFRNFNTFEDFASGQISTKICHSENDLPALLAISGCSGVGKTTLLEKLIPMLRERGYRVGVIKHSHHQIDIDRAGKDSYRLRAVGANPTMLVCDNRWALMVETSIPASFTQLLEYFQQQELDLILVEGFKHERLPKIQLHRQSINKPLAELDEFTLATATDYPLARENHLDLNNVAQIADFIELYLKR